jgi:hypothetical protein
MDAIRVTVRGDRLGLVQETIATALVAGVEVTILVRADGRAYLMGDNAGDWTEMVPGLWTVAAVPL